ncbi:SDR family oxidoreductase [Aquibium sp. LZ166]|uniref:SDR family oxidoreductase n=1 Tax=Aquibium pacificus TaxID=3153579 RepID=A0ABV3SKC8_9HYPH
MEDSRRVVVVTGAAGGIGRALVELLASDGDLVVAVDLTGTDVAQVAASLGPEHVGLTCDVSSEADILALFAQIDARFGRIDVLVNNAAMGPTMAPTIETGLDAFRKAISVNLVGPFVMAREAASRMKPGGAIVNTASLAGVLGNPRRNAYAASKAGLISLTKSLACEWAGRGIRVNAVAPGYVRTPMVAELERLGKADLAAVRRRVPMGRMGRPDEIAQALRFLASDRARYATGSVLAVDGGWASFNQPGDAHAPVDGTPAEELALPDLPDNGRIVAVTGAARGIGEAIARTFAANGDTVVALDQDGAGAMALANSLGSPHLGLALDVTLEKPVVEAFEAIRARFGRIDLLINNAAIADAFKPALDQSPSDLEAVLDVNLAGAFLCSREALKAMGSGGMILNVGSINTFLPFAPRHAYGASKAGIDILTRCMAAELGPSGIRTATIAPGYIRTPGVAALEREGHIDTLAIRRRIPMGDLGRPEDIADAALFLVSPEASYVNGSILYVDGGWTSFGNAGNACMVGGDTATEAAE